MPWLDHRTNDRLQGELENLSKKGLALAQSGDSGLRLRLFDGSRTELPMACCPERTVVRISGGNRVTLVAAKAFLGDPDLSKVSHFMKYMFARGGPVVLADITTGSVVGRSRFQVRATAVAASPSGRSFAFIGSPQGLFDAAESLYVAGFDDSQARRLVPLHHSQADVIDPSNSPDLDWASDEKPFCYRMGATFKRWMCQLVARAF
jgi:hypothetical protein